MPYRLKRKEDVAEGVRRIVIEQIDRSLEGLSLSAEDVDEAVHDARKRLKKLRAVLKMVRGALEQDTYKRENGAFRDAGRLLAELRDAVVRIQTLDSLAREAGGPPPSYFLAVRDLLVRDYEAERKKSLEAEDQRPKAAEEIEQVRDRVSDWPIDGEGFKVLEAGLRKSYQRGRKAFRRAYQTGAEADFHEWRKRTKDLRYQIRALRNLWKTPMKALRNELHDLTDILGELNDLRQMKETTAAYVREGTRGEAAETMFPLIEERAGRLRKAARPVGERIWAESPKKFLRRLGAYWDAWRRKDRK